MNILIDNANMGRDGVIPAWVGTSGLGMPAVPTQGRPDAPAGDFAEAEKILAAFKAASPLLNLPPPRSDPTSQSNVDIYEKFGEIDFSLISIALFEAGKELRAANRQMRHHERDIAVGENMKAAEKIRSAALFSLIFSVIGSAVNIGMSAFSLIKSAQAAKGLLSASKQTQTANLEMKTTQANLDTGKAQMNLKAAQTESAASRAKLNEAKVHLDESKARFNAEKAKLDAAKTGAEHAAPANKAEAETRVKNQEAKTAEAEKTMRTHEAEAKTAEQNHAKAEANEAKARSEVETNAKIADKANSEELSNLKDEKASLTEQKTKVQNKINAEPEDSPKRAELENQRTDLNRREAVVDSRIQACENNAAMYREPTSSANLDAAVGRTAHFAQELSPTGGVAA